jgi:opacity protein-like surface antigen
MPDRYTFAIAAALLAAAPSIAQADPPKNNVAIKNTHIVDDGGAMKGVNSFTQEQARTHIAKSGFTNVSALKKDTNGVWRGTAIKDGHAVHVGLGFKGNVSTKD